MRISDWSSDVCSSDLDFDYLKIGPAALVFQQQSIFRKSVKPRCPGIAQIVWREPFLKLAFNRITEFSPAAGTIPCSLDLPAPATLCVRIGHHGSALFSSLTWPQEDTAIAVGYGGKCLDCRRCQRSDAFLAALRLVRQEKDRKSTRLNSSH